MNVKYNGDSLRYFCQWKMLCSGEYVLGMEPMNAFLDGPKIGQEGCQAPILSPGESKTYTVRFTCIDKL